MATVKALGQSQFQNQLLQLVMDFDCQPAAPAKVLPFKPSVQEWSDDDVLTLRERLLMETLKAVASPGRNAENRAQALQWLQSDEIHPFSFVVCAQSMGVEPEDVRIRTLHLARKAGLDVGKEFCADKGGEYEHEL